MKYLFQKHKKILPTPNLLYVFNEMLRFSIVFTSHLCIFSDLQTYNINNQLFFSLKQKDLNWSVTLQLIEKVPVFIKQSFQLGYI